MLKRFFAEFLATAILVLVGCGTAMAVGCADTGGIVATAAAFGLSILILAYTVGPISGGHANPAVSFAKAINKEITWKEFAIYCCAQVLGAFFGSLLLAMVMWTWKSGSSGANAMQPTMLQAGSAAAGFKDYVTGMAFKDLSMGAKVMTTMLSTMAEMGLTFLFIFCVLGVTSKKEWAGFAGIVIGLALFGVHLVGINLTGTSVNPARALSALVFNMFNGQDVGLKALTLIPTIVGPFMGSFAAASVWKAFNKKKEAKAEEPAKEAE